MQLVLFIAQSASYLYFAMLIAALVASLISSLLFNGRSIGKSSLPVFVLLFVLLLTLGYANAQTLFGLPFDIGQYFASTAAFAATLVALVAFLRKQFMPALDGTRVQMFTFILGIGLALIGWFLGQLPDKNILEALTFGVTAAGIAIASVDGIRTATTVSYKPNHDDGIPPSGAL